MMNASPSYIYDKAVARYLRDAERLGRTAEKPISQPENAVDIQARRVHLQGQAGPIGTYTFALTKRGYLRFRPLWEESDSEIPPPPESVTQSIGKPRLRRDDVSAVARLMRDRGDASVREAAVRLGVAAQEVEAWQARVEAKRKEERDTNESHTQELRRLRRENEALKRDKDFLSQACAFFAKQACAR